MRTSHGVLVRINPKGERGLFRCEYCKEENLRIEDVFAPCGAKGGKHLDTSTRPLERHQKPNSHPMGGHTLRCKPYSISSFGLGVQIYSIAERKVCLFNS